MSDKLSTQADDGDGSGNASARAIGVLKKGDALGRYLVLEQLGAGAMGVVYAAYDPELDRKIAIKILRPQEGAGDGKRRQERLVREAKAMAKLSHPNVGAIHDVGMHGDQVFLAMEFLSGGTLSEWLAARKRPWREIVKMFVEVGKGLAGAHAEGLVHRDFKPDNVLLDKNGVPKVVDFGLVRLTRSIDANANEDAEASALRVSETEPVALTRTGALTGTPAYMAPEQFLGRPIDARTDQFAYAVALYEALYAERPFAGDTLVALGSSVAEGRIRPTPRKAEVPNWLRTRVIRGLNPDPAERYPSCAALIDAIRTNPVTRIRWGAGISALVLLLIVIIAGIERRAGHRQREYEQQIFAHLRDGDTALADARSRKDRLVALRKEAFNAFDTSRNEDAERIWNDARAAAAQLAARLTEAQNAFGAALNLDQKRDDIRKTVCEVILERAWLAELEFRRDEVRARLQELAGTDTSGVFVARWHQPALVSIATIPAGAALTIEQYDDGPGSMKIRQAVASSPTPVTDLSLAPGSYRLRITRPEYVEAFLPVLIKRAERQTITVNLVAIKNAPNGFAFVPAGRFLYGDADEEWRIAFLNAVPIHERQTEDYFIKRNETTFAEWIEYLEDLPPAERRVRLPSCGASAAQGLNGSVNLKQQATGGWVLDLDIVGHRFSALQGGKIVFSVRPSASAAQDWLRLPVTGISPKDMQAYVAWLARTKRLPGARLCTGAEWERAARGADGRDFPSAFGRLQPTEANVDVTYGRHAGAYGPDEVGRHPAGRSPFGVDDMAGNVWELIAREAGGLTMRGGSYYQSSMSARSTNREPADETLRSHLLGLRVCASVPGSDER